MEKELSCVGVGLNCEKGFVRYITAGKGDYRCECVCSVFKGIVISKM